MKHLRSLRILMICAFTSCTVHQSQSIHTSSRLLSVINNNFRDAEMQYKILMKNVPPDRFPKSYNPATDKFETSGSEWWCSGFYPGTLLNLFKETKDSTLLKEAFSKLKILEKEKHNKNTHDIGFMMFNSFGNANKIQPKQEYKQILMNSASSLASRFNPMVGCIKSWNSNKEDFLVIIDNMMNLELLFYATKVSGDSSFYKIAITHANTTIKNHFRSDFSSYHVINYNPETGEVQQKKTAQGYSNESAWARGQAWGLYGYTVMYRETRNKKYLQQANKIAEFILHNPNLPADKIPYWDFNAPDIPNALRDVSAGAIIASALLELSKYAEKHEAKEYFNTAEIILQNLSTDKYKANVGTNGGFLLKHSVGNFPSKTEIDVGITYADYYFIEAMQRYKSYYQK